MCQKCVTTCCLGCNRLLVRARIRSASSTGSLSAGEHPVQHTRQNAVRRPIVGTPRDEAVGPHEHCARPVHVGETGRPKQMRFEAELFGGSPPPLVRRQQHERVAQEVKGRAVSDGDMRRADSGHRRRLVGVDEQAVVGAAVGYDRL